MIERPEDWRCKTCGEDVRDSTFYPGVAGELPEHSDCRAIAKASAPLKSRIAELEKVLRNLLAPPNVLCPRDTAIVELALFGDSSPSEGDPK